MTANVAYNEGIEELDEFLRDLLWSLLWSHPDSEMSLTMDGENTEVTWSQKQLCPGSARQRKETLAFPPIHPDCMQAYEEILAIGPGASYLGCGDCSELGSYC
jgi:hypothetical protein